MTISQNQQHLTEEQQLQIIHEEIALARKNAEPDMKLAESVKRLLQNPDFKAVVSEAYFDKEMKQIALTISMNGNDDLVKRDVVRLKGIHCFREFLNKILKNGELASEYMAKSDEELVAMYQTQFDIAE